MSEDDDPQPAPITIDKVRASKAGHAYHEAWAARTALELLLPSTDLTAITLEGFDEQDELELGTGAVEIADLVRYHGGTDVASSHQVTVVQFKYSIASAAVAARAADIASTLTKFATTDAELRIAHGDAHVLKSVTYEFATNRPIHANLAAALAAIIAGAEAKGDVQRQSSQLMKALEAYPYPPAELLQRMDLIGSKGSLVEAERAISATLASWSEPSDPDAEKRLLKLRNLIRIKAGPGSETDKRVDRVAVLAELDVDHEERLYPTPDAFPDVPDVVQRAVLDNILTLARDRGSPLVVHAAGGMGKTVLMQGLADRLRADGPVVLFDGFGAGRWRDPADARHLPERTLVHLANLLAGEGLCDILLPIADETGLLRAFRRRLEQSVETARNTKQGAHISLVLDAIDHAGLAAQETVTSSFAYRLLRSLSVKPIDGVRIIGSCRTERLSIATGDCTYREFPVPPFTDAESRTLIARRVTDASPDEISALLMRSGRNPRCLDSLIETGRPFDPVKFPDTPHEPHDVLDALLRKRLADARAAARTRGASDDDINLLLAGVALLAPPVPIEELAAAQGMIAEQVESFAADLAPLIERTPHGLMFRDEPTETLIRSAYGTDQLDRDRIISALQDRQLTSNYAARALPALLTSLRDSDQLVALAYDLRVPASATLVSARDIRLARITAAISMAGELSRHDDLFRLLLEASQVAAGHERSDRFLYEHPDLAAIADDPEGLRRLAVTSVGWPGGKHAALALANAFAGDRDEARRHARRSIDWYNWAAQSKQSAQFNARSISRESDDVGFAYVEMLAGNDVRVAEFLARREDKLAFGKFRDLLDLLERHGTTSHAPTTRIARRLPGCRLQSRALFAAAMQFTDRDPVRDRRILTAMASAPPVAERSGSLAASCLLASVRAADLGLTSVARNIVEGAGLGRQSIHDYSSYYPVDRTTDLTLLAAGVRSALRRRPVTLLDIAPAELLDLVPPSARSRGAAAFSSSLRKKLAEPKADGSRRRRRRDGLDGEKRSNYSRALSHRITPLVRYAQDVAEIICPPDGRSRNEMLNLAFDRLVAEVESSSNYPYRDGKEYLARTGFRAIFNVADALGALDAALAKRIADWLADAPGLFAPDLTETVTRLSRIPQCHDAALILASHVEGKIQFDTDVGTRITAYGRLARAVWRVSVEEAKAYFRRALDLAEAIGSDDFDRTNHLLELTGHYAGPELSPSGAHTLARILELNQGEDGRFPWIEYARSMAPVAGRGMLAMLARLDDRDVARLGLSLGPALTALTRHSKLSAASAAALFGLAPPGEAWTWHISDLASEVLNALPAQHHEWFFSLLLVEIDRDDQLTPARDTIEGLHRLAQQFLPEPSPSRKRIDGLVARRGPQSDSPPPAPRVTDEQIPVFPLDLSDPDEIDRQILNEESDQLGQRWPLRTLRNLAQRPMTPAERLGFVRAVVESGTATLADKVSALDDYLEEWGKSSAAMRDALPGLGLRLASKHATELASSSTDAWGGWRGLERHFRADRVGLIEQVVSGLRGAAPELGGNAWLALAARLAANVSAGAIATGLERFLATSADKLPAEVGDGPWHNGFTVPSQEEDLAAALVWARLGHPVAAMRWRAAHTVRRLAEIGQFDVVDALIERFDSGAAQPFTDAKLPFYPMHAQLWLLIALARQAKDTPGALAKHRPFFEKIALSTDFPHVIMRAFAADCLREVGRMMDPADSKALSIALAAANRSPFPHAPRQDYTEHLYASRPESRPKPDDAFELDYDFNKYQVARLCHVFACPGWEVKDHIRIWARRLVPELNAMHECPRSGTYDESWSSGYVPDRDRHGGYLAWHALMLVAGEMLASRPVVGEDWSGDAWAAFLNEYRLSRDDGLWLADLTDPFPLDLHNEGDIPMPDRDGRPGSVRDDVRLLAPLFGFANGKVSAHRLIVAGRWSISHNTTLTVSSVLASQRDVRSAAMTLLSDQPFFRWLPDDDDEIVRNFGEESHTVLSWVAETPNTQRQLDRHDPYGCTSALDRPFPTDFTKEKLDASPDDPIVRQWSTGGTPAFFAEAWGAEGGRGENAWSEAGSRIFVSVEALTRMLETTDLSLLLFVKLRKYHKGKSSHRVGDTSSFTHRSLIVSVNKRGDVWIPQRLSKQVKLALEALDADRLRDFYPRFRAIAGLPDEWLARRKASLAGNAELYRTFIVNLDNDDTEL